jgi:hypothetical protein
MKVFDSFGDSVTIPVASIVAPNNPPKSGDPCIAGAVLVGVANQDGSVGGSIVLSRRGIYNLSVLAKHAGAVNDAVAVGDQVFIDASTAVLSKDATDVPFGVALDAVTSGATATIRVLIVQAVGVAALTQSGPATDGVTAAVASGAIAVASGTVSLGSGGALAMTLATPASPGDDGKQIFVIAVTAHAHKITTAANKIVMQGATGDTLTFAAVADSVLLEAIGGLWYVRDITATNPALTEV